MTKKRVDLDIRPMPQLVRNYDYGGPAGGTEVGPGTGLYHGEMSKYKSVEDFLNKARKRRFSKGYKKRKSRKQAFEYIVNRIIISKKAQDKLITPKSLLDQLEKTLYLLDDLIINCEYIIEKHVKSPDNNDISGMWIQRMLENYLKSWKKTLYESLIEGYQKILFSKPNKEHKTDQEENITEEIILKKTYGLLSVVSQLDYDCAEYKKQNIKAKGVDIEWAKLLVAKTDAFYKSMRELSIAGQKWIETKQFAKEFKEKQR